jgi:hypothetical protein
MALTKVRGSGLDSSQEGAITFNEGSADVDFRVEGNGNASMLVVDAGNDRVGVGTNSPTATFHVSGDNPRARFTDTPNSVNFDIFMGDDNAVIGMQTNHVLKFMTNDAERMRLDESGRLLIGATTYDADNAGIYLNGASGKGFFTVSGDAPLAIHRLASDGDLVELRQAGSTEGTISVSGSTVSYNGFSGQHESSGIATNTEIGTVISTIDELDTYASGEKKGQTRADHAKVKVSDTAGDKAVYGVVSRFDADDKVYVASVGIGSVRVTGACAKGDLLESNGDGTAKVQSDDIVRSKTIGKVTIGNSSSGVKLVSCVLYCG